MALLQPKLKANMAVAQAKAEALLTKTEALGSQPKDPKAVLEARNAAPLQPAEIAATVMPSQVNCLMQSQFQAEYCVVSIEEAASDVRPM